MIFPPVGRVLRFLLPRDRDLDDLMNVLSFSWNFALQVPGMI
jgi:hypothetical protein